MIPDETTLVARIRSGDANAFAKMFRAHYNAATDYAARLLRDAAAAEDIVQDVFARIHERRAQLDVTSSLRGYLISAVRREALHALRHGRVVTRHAQQTVATGPSEISPTADSALAESELIAVVERCVAQLPERCREAYELRWRYELSYGEIAESMGISVKTVEMQITRALKVVRSAVSEYLGEGRTG